jgi:hypothetical protein
MPGRRRPPSQGWKTFLANHADGIAAMDFFGVPTVSFKLLYGLLILHHDRRQIMWLEVTRNPIAERIARQLVEAYAWQLMPKYVLRDRDWAYGVIFNQRMKAMGIRDRPISPRSPLIGSIRRDCHVAVFDERHFRHILKREPYPSGILERYTDFARSPGRRSHCISASPRRVASCTRPDLVSNNDSPHPRLRYDVHTYHALSRALTATTTARRSGCG